MSQKIELTVSGQELVFDVSNSDYNNYINAMLPNNKVAPAHNFLMSTVTEETKQALKDVLTNNPGAAVQICGHVSMEFAPALDVQIKKPSRPASD